MLTYERGRRVMLMGNMNRRVDNNEVASVVGKLGVERVSENSEHLGFLLYLIHPLSQIAQYSSLSGHPLT